MKRTRVLIMVVPALTMTALIMTGCAGTNAEPADPGPPSVPPATPTVLYDGPLRVEPQGPANEFSARRAGAAGRVLQCEHDVHGTSLTLPYEGTLTRRSAAAVTAAWDDYLIDGIRNGYVQLRSEGSRVLFGVTVDDRVRQAAVVRRTTTDGRTGWYVESWARCDYAELLDAVAEHDGLQVWTDAAGKRAPTTAVVSQAGPAHCDWQAMTFVDLAGGDLAGGDSYVGNADPELSDWFAGPYRPGVDRPADATDTGFRRDGRALWLSADRRYAYVQTSAGSDRYDGWPQMIKPLTCS